MPGLDETNARFYRSAEAPTFILYRHEAIDGEHPLQVDPLAWLELIRWYGIDDQFGDTLLLKRRKTPRFGELTEGSHQSVRLGERVEVPQDESCLCLIRTQFSLRPSGRLRETLFRMTPPSIKVEYMNGTTALHRLVWRNAVSGLLVSDLPTNIASVRSLWQSGVGSPVKAVTFLANSHYYRDTLDITWVTFPFARSGFSNLAEIESGWGMPDNIAAFHASSKILWKWGPDAGSAGIEAIQQIAMHKESAGLVMDSSGDDPITFLPATDTLKDIDVIVRLEVISPANSFVQLYYQTEECGEYCEQHSVMAMLQQGHNVRYLRISEPKLAGRIRFDPIACPGRIVLKSFEMRTVKREL